MKNYLIEQNNPKKKLSKSKFASKNVICAFEELFEKIKNIKYWMISYNSNATPKKEIFIEMIYKYKKILILKKLFSKIIMAVWVFVKIQKNIYLFVLNYLFLIIYS